MAHRQFPLLRPILPLLVVALMVGSIFSQSASAAESEYATGLAEYQRGNYKGAVASFEASLAKGNGSAANYFYIGHSYAALGRKQQAVNAYRKIEKSFKGLPAAKMAAQCIQKIDPQNLYSPEPAKTGGASATAPVRSFPRGQSLINRVNVIAPTITGHPSVGSGTVGAIRSLVSRLPSNVYAILDEGGVTINIGPNITDKWPEKGNISKPGMERYTMAQVGGLTEGRDIYIWERAAEVGSKELDEPFGSEHIKDEFFSQVGHALNNCLGISNETDFNGQYEIDKAAISTDDKRREQFYLQPDGAGAREVCATTIATTLGADPDPRIEKHFKKSRDWVKTRMEQEYRNRSALSTRGARPVGIARTGATTGGAGSKTQIASTSTPGALKTPEEATLSMPAEERVPYTRTAGNHLYVRGEINGRPTHILVDTGAFKVVIGKQDLIALGIKPPEGASEIIGAGASGALRGWEMPLEISIGRIKRKLPVQVLDGKQAMLLGQPFLSGMHYQIDRASSYIHFTRDARDVQKQMSYDSVEIPFRMLNGNLMVAGKVNGVSTEMNFDTGAPYTLFRSMSIWEFGLDVLGPTTVHGAGGSGSSAYVCRADTVELGSIRKTGVQVVVGSAVGHNVLGQDFFGQMKFIVDNEKHVIRIAR